MILKSTQIQIQKPVLAPSMQQSIEVLLLPLVELSQQIELELQENPMLEIADPAPDAEDHKIEQMLDQSIDYLQHHSPQWNSYESNTDDDPAEHKQISQDTCLIDYLLQQLHLELSDATDITIGEFIIGNLDENGFLKCTLEEMSQLLGINDTERIERVLKTVQHFDPLGVAARDLKECLLVQAPYYLNGHSSQVIPIIEGHLEDLGRKKFADIARTLKVPVEEIKEASLLIARLEPIPARRFVRHTDTVYVKPDITITKDTKDNLHYFVNNERIPKLRISATYRSFLNKPKLTQEESEYIREKIKNGLLFIKSIEQRRETLKGITEFLLERQKDFFSEGVSALKPMVLKDVAQAIGRNESTISRAISNKYMDTPQGLLPMKYFFSQGVSQQEKTSVSNRCIQEELKTIVETEDKAKPFSDQDLVDMLNRRGLQVARRTITKYRKALNILPSNLRKL